MLAVCPGDSVGQVLPQNTFSRQQLHLFFAPTDETIDQRDTCTEISAKDIVGILLEEILRSAVIVSDKGYSRIGDFNITEDFSQQFDEQVCPNYIKDLDRINLSHNPSATNQDLNLNSGENFDHSVSLLTARENLEFILDSFVKKEEKVKNLNECKVISQEILADNELQIQNGQIHLETNRSSGASKRFLEPARHEYFKKEDIIKDEKIEIEYFNDGKINKIYVPLTKAPSKEPAEFSFPAFECTKNEEESAEAFTTNLSEDRATEQAEDAYDRKAAERPFTPFTTEELRQVWENGNSSSIVGRWDGDMSTQPEEVVRLMEELSSVQVYPDAPADPNRPRACAFDEEDVKRMIKEIEEINFNQSHLASEDFDLTYHPDGQGDADLESKSFNTKDNFEKTPKGPKEFLNDPGPESKSFTKDKNNSKKSLRDLKEIEELSWSFATEENNEWDRNCEFPSESEVDKRGTDVEEYLTESELSKGSTSQTCYDESLSCGRQIVGSLETSDHTDSIHSEISVSDSINKLRIQYELSDKERLTNSEGGEERSAEEEGVDDEAAGAVGVQPSASYTVPRGEDDGKGREESSPSSTSFSEAIVGYQNIYKQREICLKEFQYNSEKDSNLILEVSDSVRGSRSVNDTVHDFSSDINLPVGGGASSLGRLQSESHDGLSTVKSFFDRKETNLLDAGLIPEEKESANYVENKFGLFYGRSEATIEGRQSNVSNKSDKSMEKPWSFSQEDGKGLREIECEMDVFTALEKEGRRRISYQGSDLKFVESIVTENESNKTIKSSGSDQTHSEPSTSSSPPTVSQNEDESDDDPAQLPPTFRLHSQKMYLGTDYNPGNVGANELVLTDSEEAFIESTENVIQVINPPDTNADEDSNISFSLLNETRPAKSCNSKISEAEVETDTDLPFDPDAKATPMRRNEKSYSKQMSSGMTTIGPIKNIDYDPKDLTGPDIDFGKMTRITSSRQLAKDLFGTELKTSPSVKILDRNNFGEDCSLSIEGERVDLGSLVNRDIASLTKVQKVREVMSYHPKPDEDFEDDDTLTRPRLDLKDVESMTDERYKVPDVSIPLLSFEVETNSQEPDKDFVQNMRLVLSGNCFNNSSYLEHDVEGDNIETSRKQSTIKRNTIKISESLEKLQKAQSSTSSRQEAEENVDVDTGKDEGGTELSPDHKGQATEIPSSDFQCGGASSHHKYGTLGTVLKKASSKFIGKDGDLYVRSSKSLPRDATKLTTSDSIKSILDECHSSASNVLKKSRSLLKNTQSIFKTLSQNRFNVHDSSGNLEKQKPSPSESEIGHVDKKLSSFLRKEDFSKAKIIVKSKVEKSFKNADGATPRSEHEMAPDNRDLRVVVRNEENYRVDKMENFRKFLPKSHLVYKSQFVRSPLSVPDNSEPLTVCRQSDNELNFVDPCSEVLEDEEKTERITEEGSESAQSADSKEKIEIPPENKLCEGMTWINHQHQLYAIECEPEPPGFIVMETVQGLPVTDFETSTLCELNKPNKKATLAKVEKPPSERGNANEEFTEVAVVGEEASPRLSDEDEVKEKGFREKKSRSKNKKLSARIRSFWCSAFGRARTPPAKTNPS